MKEKSECMCAGRALDQGWCASVRSARNLSFGTGSDRNWQTSFAFKPPVFFLAPIYPSQPTNLPWMAAKLHFSLIWPNSLFKNVHLSNSENSRPPPPINRNKDKAWVVDVKTAHLISTNQIRQLKLYLKDERGGFKCFMQLMKSTDDERQWGVAALKAIGQYQTWCVRPSVRVSYTALSVSSTWPDLSSPEIPDRMAGRTALSERESLTVATPFFSSEFRSCSCKISSPQWRAIIDFREKIFRRANWRLNQLWHTRTHTHTHTQTKRVSDFQHNHGTHRERHACVTDSSIVHTSKCEERKFNWLFC